MKKQLTSYEEYVEQLETSLLVFCPKDFKRCLHCEKVFCTDDMYYDTDYCERCAKFVGACEEIRLEELWHEEVNRGMDNRRDRDL